MEFTSAQVALRPNQHVGMASHGNDKGLFVTFYNEAIQQGAESERQGRPVFKDVPHVHILFPGDRTKEVRRPVRLTADDNTPSDPERWPAQWQAFQSQGENQLQGLPITEWAPLTKSQAMELKAMHIHTVEQLAELPDHTLTWMGARELREHARSFLAQAKDGAENARLRAENEALRTDVEMLKKQMSELMAGKTRTKKLTEELA